MRGSPLWQVMCVVLMFAAASVPVWRLTAPASPAAVAAAPAPVGSAAAETPLEIAVGFAPAPTDFSLRYLGETTVLAGHGPAADFTVRWTVKLPVEGVDLTLQAHWPETAGHTAAQVVVRFPDGHETAKTVWGDAGQPMVENITITP